MRRTEGRANEFPLQPSSHQLSCGKRCYRRGFLPQFLGFELCQRIENTLQTENAFPYLEAQAAEVLAARRDALARILRQSDGVDETPDEIRGWTFAGGRINSKLRHALVAIGLEATIIPDNLLLRIRSEGPDPRLFAEARRQLAEPTLWDDEKLWAEIAAELPAYRLSKFQPLMPPWIGRETLARHLLDTLGTRRFLTLPVGK